MQTPYSISAKYYDDAYAVKPDLVDLPFYVELARQIGGPILEMGCGTGRVLLPIAREGIEIHGLDSSPAMLKIFRERIQNELEEGRNRITLHEGDMRQFRGQQRYRLVTIPFRAMQHMYTLEDQVAALKTAAFHLDKNGILAFDVFFPKFQLMDVGIGEEMLELEWPVKAHPGRIIRRYFKKDSVDKINQVFNFTFIFRTYDNEALVNEETEAFKLSYYAYPQLKALFELAGLQSVEEYGSFSKEPLNNDAKEMIFLLRRAA
jgi:SAM-dependent methyltransferase